MLDLSENGILIESVERNWDLCGFKSYIHLDKDDMIACAGNQSVAVYKYQDKKFKLIQTTKFKDIQGMAFLMDGLITVFCTEMIYIYNYETYKIQEVFSPAHPINVVFPINSSSNGGHYTNQKFATIVQANYCFFYQNNQGFGIINLSTKQMH